MDTNWIEDSTDWTEEQYARWADKWALHCPIGNPQRVRGCTAYREREPGRLQLRVALGLGEGVCQAIVDEQDDVVYVRVLVCYEEDEVERAEQDYCNCPVHVYLDRPLGDRTVIDVDNCAELPVYEPTWAIPE